MLATASLMTPSRKMIRFSRSRSPRVIWRCAGVVPVALNAGVDYVMVAKHGNGPRRVQAGLRRDPRRADEE